VGTNDMSIKQQMIEQAIPGIIVVNQPLGVGLYRTGAGARSPWSTDTATMSIRRLTPSPTPPSPPGRRCSRQDTGTHATPQIG
jgi:hypothetical protein